MIKYQNYKHYKLPISINPLDYGKLIIKIDELKLFVVQVNRTNIAVIQIFEDLNQIKLFKEGDLILEYNDHKTDDNIFIRSLNNTKFTFKNNKLITISTEKSLNRVNLIHIYFVFINCSQAILKLNRKCNLKHKIKF